MTIIRRILEKVKKYDIIFNSVGHISYNFIKRKLKAEGVYTTLALNGALIIQSLWSKLFSKKKVHCGVTFASINNVLVVREFLEKGFLKEVIDRNYPLNQLLEVFRYVEEGHRTGTVLITPTMQNNLEKR
ncbi:zinc-binding dehydrogenase [Domibacillus mangrovi]|uniref:zinc-binding dehydrogenase n=1 Tax=Domibacillus mangrovi TaxID=1714354 RepID=UPI0009FB4730